ncbi:MAG TPA: hypothetical protein VF721_05755 [Pyrinomonadaceae bacterium]
MSEEYPYQKKWERYRLYVTLWVIMLPLLFAPHLLLANDVSFFPRKALIYSIILFWIVFIVLIFIIMFWKCPRCRQFYFRWWVKISILSEFECKNCGLEKYKGSDIKSLSKKFGKRFGF